MANDAELRSMLIDTLNESDPPLNFTDDTIDYAIRLAKIMVFSVTGEGSQEQFTAQSSGSTKIPIDDDVMRIIRLDSYGDGCGLERITVEDADSLNPGWRGCDYSGDEPTGYILDPNSPTDLWIHPAPAPGTTVNFTAVVATTDNTPEKLLPPIRHLALSICYERIYGNNANREYHWERGYAELEIIKSLQQENASG